MKPKVVDIRRIVKANIAYYMAFYDLNSDDMAAALGVHRTTFERKYKITDDTAFDTLELQRCADKCKCSIIDLLTPKGGTMQ